MNSKQIVKKCVALALACPLLMTAMMSCVTYKSKDAVNIARLSEVGRLIEEYSHGHHGDFPAIIIASPISMTKSGRQGTEDSMDLLARSLQQYRFIDPVSNCEYDWLYFKGHSERDLAKTIIAAAPAPFVGPRGVWRAVLYADFTCEPLSEAVFSEKILNQEAKSPPG